MGDQGGRPTDYKEEYNDLAFRFALLGATDEQLADALGVCVKTINNWKHEYPKFLHSIKKGKTDADAKVAQSLYKRACGYQYDEVTYEKSKPGGLGINLKAGNVDEVKHVDVNKTKVVVKEVAPDTAAAFIWLKNRQGDKWKDRKESSVNIENADEYFKAIADAVTQSDTDPGQILP